MGATFGRIDSEPSREAKSSRASIHLQSRASHLSGRPRRLTGRSRRYPAPPLGPILSARAGADSGEKRADVWAYLTSDKAKRISPSAVSRACLNVRCTPAGQGARGDPAAYPL